MTVHQSTKNRSSLRVAGQVLHLAKLFSVGESYGRSMHNIVNQGMLATKRSTHLSSAFLDAMPMSSI